MSDTARIDRFKRFTVEQITESSHGPLVAVCLYARSSDQTPRIEFAVDPQTAIQMAELIRDVGQKLTTPLH